MFRLKCHATNLTANNLKTRLQRTFCARCKPKLSRQSSRLKFLDKYFSLFITLAVSRLVLFFWVGDLYIYLHFLNFTSYNIYKLHDSTCRNRRHFAEHETFLAMMKKIKKKNCLMEFGWRKLFWQLFHLRAELGKINKKVKGERKKLVTETDERKRAKHKCNLKLIKLVEINFCSRNQSELTVKLSTSMALRGRAELCDVKELKALTGN